MAEDLKAIYGLVDPRDGKVRVIGASRHPEKRYVQCLRQGWGTAQPWLDDLKKEGMRPDLRVFTDPTPGWRVIETQLQARYGDSLLEKGAAAKNRVYNVNHGMLRDTVADNLTKARIDAGFDREQAALALDVSPVTVSRWETGTRTPELGTLYQIASAYGITPHALLPEDIPASQGAEADIVAARAKKLEGITDGN